jgi:predicted AAA+ superfamily ATPase
LMYLEELLKLRESDGIDVSDISSWDSGTVGNASDRLIVSGRIEIEV